MYTYYYQFQEKQYKDKVTSANAKLNCLTRGSCEHFSVHIHSEKKAEATFPLNVVATSNH